MTSFSQQVTTKKNWGIAVYLVLAIMALVLPLCTGCGSQYTSSESNLGGFIRSDDAFEGLNELLRIQKDHCAIPWDEMWDDIALYAEAYTDGTYDGSDVYRDDYHNGEKPYVRVTERGLLSVDGIYVRPGFVLTDASPEGLLKALEEDYGWRKETYGVAFAHSPDYRIEYVYYPKAGYIRVMDNYNLELLDSVVFGATEYDMDFQEAVRAFQSGDITGRVFLREADVVIDGTLTQDGVRVWDARMPVKDWQYFSFFV